MTKPKRHLPGEPVLITRRTLNRLNLLGSGKDTREVVEYALALYAPKCGIDVHALVVMSNHIHLVITDTRGHRSDFMRAFFGLIARARNMQLGRSDSFWTGAPPGDCVLLGDETVWKKCLYTWMNPQEAGQKQWRGFSVGHEHWSKKKEVHRPSAFFSRSCLPQQVSYTPVPPLIEDHSPEEVKNLYSLLMAASAFTEDKGETCSKSAKRPSWQPSGTRPKDFGKLNPQYAGPSNYREAYAEELGEFRSLYAEALQKTREGNFDEACFPPGTIRAKNIVPKLCSDKAQAPRSGSCS